MRLFKSCLASLLAASLALGVAGASIPQNPKAEGAGAERDRGRELLRRGQAGEALIHLENALKAFKQSGDRSAEAVRPSDPAAEIRPPGSPPTGGADTVALFGPAA